MVLDSDCLAATCPGATADQGCSRASIFPFLLALLAQASIIPCIAVTVDNHSSNICIRTLSDSAGFRKLLHAHSLRAQTPFIEYSRSSHHGLRLMLPHQVSYGLHGRFVAVLSMRVRGLASMPRNR